MSDKIKITFKTPVPNKKIEVKLKKPEEPPVLNELVTPKLVKLQKKKGQLVHPYDVYIGRRISNPNWRLDDSIWGNPFKINPNCPREQAIELYREYLLAKPELLQLLPTLSGKVLGCWCYPEKCHGEVLIELFDKKAWMVS